MRRSPIDPPLVARRRRTSMGMILLGALVLPACFNPVPAGDFDASTGASEGSAGEGGTTPTAAPTGNEVGGESTTDIADSTGGDATTGGESTSEASSGGQTRGGETTGDGSGSSDSETSGGQPATVCPVFFDSFDDDVQDPLWVQPYPASTTESGGEAVISVTSAVNDEFARMMVAPEEGGLSNATARLEIGTPPPDGIFFIFWVEQAGGEGRIAYQLANEGGVTMIQVRITTEAGVASIVESAAWDSTTMHWLGLREEAGTLYFEGSEDGGAYDIVFQMPTPIDVSDVLVGFVGHNSFELAADAQVSVRSFELICGGD